MKEYYHLLKGFATPGEGWCSAGWIFIHNWGWHN